MVEGREEGAEREVEAEEGREVEMSPVGEMEVRQVEAVMVRGLLAAANGGWACCYWWLAIRC